SAQFCSTSYRRIQNALRTIREPTAHTAQQRTVDHVQVRSSAVALRTSPERLRAPEMARLALDLDLDLFAADAQHQGLARDPGGGRRGYLFCIAEEALDGSRGVSGSKASDHFEEITSASIFVEEKAAEGRGGFGGFGGFLHFHKENFAAKISL